MKLVRLSSPLLVLLVAATSTGLGCGDNVPLGSLNQVDALSPGGDLGSGGVGAVFAGQTNGSVSVLRSFTTVSADNATNSGGASPTLKSACRCCSAATVFYRVNKF